MHRILVFDLAPPSPAGLNSCTDLISALVGEGTVAPAAGVGKGTPTDQEIFMQSLKALVFRASLLACTLTALSACVIRR
jgi:hypothetical protein